MDFRIATAKRKLVPPTDGYNVMPSLRLDAVDTSTTARSALSGRRRIALHCALCAFLPIHKYSLNPFEPIPIAD